eukprot:240126_1
MADCSNAEPNDESECHTNGELLSRIKHFEEKDKQQSLNIKQLRENKTKLQDALDAMDDEHSLCRSKIQKFDIINGEYKKEVELLKGDIHTLKEDFKTESLGKDQTIAKLEQSLADIHKKHDAVCNERAEKSEIIENMTLNVNNLRKQCEALNLQNKEIQTKNDALTTQIEQMNALKDTANQRETSLNDTLNDANLENNRLNEQIESNQLELTNQTQTIDQLKQQIVSLEAQISEAAQHKCEVEQQTQTFTQQIEAFTTEIDGFRTVISQHEDAQTQSNQRIQELTATVHELQTEKEQIQSQISSKDDEMKTRDEAIAKHVETIESLKQCVEDKETAIRALNTDIDETYKKKVSECTIQNQTMSAELTVAVSKISSLESTVEGLKNDKISCSEYNTAQLKEKQAEMERLSHDIQQKDQQFVEANQKLTILQEVYNTLEAQNEENVTALQKGCEENETLRSRLEGEMAAMKTREEEHVKTIGGLKDQIQELEEMKQTVVEKENACAEFKQAQQELCAKMEEKDKQMQGKEDMVKELEGKVKTMAQLHQVQKDELHKLNEQNLGTKTRIVELERKLKEVDAVKTTNQEAFHKEMETFRAVISQHEDAQTQSNQQIQELTASVHELQTEKEQIESQISSKDDEMKTRDEAIAKHVETIESLKQCAETQSNQQTEQLTATVHELQIQKEQMSSKDDQIKLKDEAIAKHVETIASLKQGVEEKETQIQALKTASEEMSARLQEISTEMEQVVVDKRKRLQELNEQMEGIRKTCTEELESKDKQTEDARSKLNELKAQLSEVTTRDEGNTNKLAEIQEECAALKNSLSAYQTNVEAHESELNGLKQKCDTLQGELRQKSTQILNLEHEQTVLKEHTLKTLQQENERLNGELSAVQSLNQELSQSVKNLGTDFTAKAGEFEKNNQELKANLNTYKKYETASKKMIGKLKKNLAAKQEEIKVLESNVERQKTRVTEIQSENDKILLEYNTLAKQMSQNQLSTQEFEGKIKHLQQVNEDQQKHMMQVTLTLEDTSKLNEELKTEVNALTAKINIAQTVEIEAQEYMDKVKEMVQNINDSSDMKWNDLQENVGQHCDAREKTLSGIKSRVGKLQSEYLMKVKECEELEKKQKPICDERDAMEIELTSAQKKNKKLNKFLMGKGLMVQELPSFFILPVQRLPRYILLLTDLRKNTMEDTTEYEEIDEAVEQVKGITEEINERLALSLSQKREMKPEEEMALVKEQEREPLKEESQENECLKKDDNDMKNDSDMTPYVTERFSFYFTFFSFIFIILLYIRFSYFFYHNIF